MGATPWRFKSSQPHLLFSSEKSGFRSSRWHPDFPDFSPLWTKWGQHGLCVGFESPVFSRQPTDNSAMASLVKRNDSYRIVFRFGGREFSRSLKTTDEKSAALTRARLEDNLRRLKLSTLTIEPEDDVVAVPLSSGLARSWPPADSSSCAWWWSAASTTCYVHGSLVTTPAKICRRDEARE